jgi:hypothetical protein
MLDVHAPHAEVSTWKGFLIHIATICIGLLIAVALEQSVEALHRHREASILREELRAESRQILHDARSTEAAQVYELRWLATRIAQVRAAVWGQGPLEPRPANHMPIYASPDIPIWRSAKASGRTQLLSKGETNAYAEIEYVQVHVDGLADARNRSEEAVTSFNQELPALPDGQPDFGKAGPQDLRRYLSLLTQASAATSSYLLWLRNLAGAESAVIEGKVGLEDIYLAERQASGHLAEVREAM